jgi:hypothetical protein
MRLGYLRELDAKCRRIFYVVRRDDMADSAARLEPLSGNRDFGFFDTMRCDDTDPFALEAGRVVGLLGHKLQKMFVARRRRQKMIIHFREGRQIVISMMFFYNFPSG